VRLAQTASLAWLAAAVLRHERSVRAMLLAVVVSALLGIGIAVGEALASGGAFLTERYGGLE
jgi:hypothetical protein